MFWFCEKCHWYFDDGCIKSVDCLRLYDHFKNIDLKMMIFKILFQFKNNDANSVIFIQHSFGSPKNSNQRRKTNKRNLSCKRSKTHCLQTTWYNVEKIVQSTRKLLMFINEFSKVARYKNNIQKSDAFLYTNNKLSGREIKETTPFTIVSKRIKYLGVNLPKEG